MSQEPKNVLVIGLGESGRAAAHLAVARGASVTVADTRPADHFANAAGDALAEMRRAGIVIEFDCRAVPPGGFDLAVVSPGLSPRSDLWRSLEASGIPVLGELEYGWRRVARPTVAVTGTNGKTTTTELIAHLMAEAGRSSVAAGNIGLPVSRVALAEPRPDILILEVSSFQMETAQAFCPEVAVLLNLTPDHLDRHGSMAEYARVKARVLADQSPAGTAIIQSEALAYLRVLKVPVPGRLITFSANTRRADLYYEDGLIVGSLPGWSGPLLSLQQTHLRGPHNAENVMAAIAAGRELGLNLEQMVRAVKSYRPGAHRYEAAGELHGVQFVNDSKATNLHAMIRAIEATPSIAVGEPNILLVAGGSEKGLEFHEAGPLLARRVRTAFLIGESAESMKAAWGLFINCKQVSDLEEAVIGAMELAEMGDVVLLSPACASFDQFTGYTHRGECFKAIVADLKTTTYGAGLPARATTDGVRGETASHEHPI